MRILLSFEGHPSTQLHTLIYRLNESGIRVAGGATADNLEAILLFDRPEDTDRAIAWLARFGIRAERG
jgi:hypothetical protein